MANATWPGGLPQYVDQSGYKETLPDNTIETPMEVGEAKVRPRNTGGFVPFSLQMRLNSAQYTIFVAFWTDTLVFGSKRFDWVHPYTRQPATFRFKKPPPSFSAQGADMIVSFAMDLMK